MADPEAEITQTERPLLAPTLENETTRATDAHTRKTPLRPTEAKMTQTVRP